MATIDIPWKGGTKTIAITKISYMPYLIVKGHNNLVIKMAQANPKYFDPTDTYEAICIKALSDYTHIRIYRKKLVKLLKCAPVPTDIFKFIHPFFARPSTILFWIKRGVITHDNFDDMIMCQQHLKKLKFLKYSNRAKHKMFVRKMTQHLYQFQALGYHLISHDINPRCKQFKWTKKQHTLYTNTVKQNVKLLFMIYKNNYHCEKIAL